MVFRVPRIMAFMPTRFASTSIPHAYAVMPPRVYARLVADGLEEAKTVAQQSPSTNVITQSFGSKTVRVFPMSTDSQRECRDWGSMRKHLFEQMGVTGSSDTTQVVGDSATFMPNGTQKGRDFLRAQLDPEDCVLYGYTGHQDEDTACANALVAQILEDRPEQAERTLANAVDLHTPMALTKWGCVVSQQVSNILLVHSPEGARFGDDIAASDGMTNKKMICLEGGVQSFSQMVNCLGNDIPISAIFNLRGDKNPSTLNKDTGEYLPFFSAAEFVGFLQSKFATMAKDQAFDIAELSRVDLDRLKDEYLSKEDGSVRRHLFNPYRPDAGTKTALFNAAWEKFIADKIWTKIPALCHVENAEPETRAAPVSRL